MLSLLFAQHGLVRSPEKTSFLQSSPSLPPSTVGQGRKRFFPPTLAVLHNDRCMLVSKPSNSRSQESSQLSALNHTPAGADRGSVAPSQSLVFIDILALFSRESACSHTNGLAQTPMCGSAARPQLLILAYHAGFVKRQNVRNRGFYRRAHRICMATCNRIM